MIFHSASGQAFNFCEVSIGDKIVDQGTNV